VTAQNDRPGSTPTPADQERRRRGRSIAIALALAAMAALFFITTIVRLGGNVAERAF
jgi:ferric-dicitrate binding protein FerR (iron transport regulator)